LRRFSSAKKFFGFTVLDEALVTCSTLSQLLSLCLRRLETTRSNQALQPTLAGLFPSQRGAHLKKHALAPGGDQGMPPPELQRGRAPRFAELRSIAAKNLRAVEKHRERFRFAPRWGLGYANPESDA
jgi:hypothetical protein